MNKERARAKMREKGMKRRKVEGDEKGTRGCAYLFYIRQVWRMQEGRLESEGLLDLRHASLRFRGATLVVSAAERLA